MTKNRVAILFFLAVAIICFFIYQEYKAPDGVTTMGDDEDIVKWAYWTAVISGITAAITLIREVIGLIREERARNG